MTKHPREETRRREASSDPRAKWVPAGGPEEAVECEVVSNYAEVTPWSKYCAILGSVNAESPQVTQASCLLAVSLGWHPLDGRLWFTGSPWRKALNVALAIQCTAPLRVWERFVLGKSPRQHSVRGSSTNHLCLDILLGWLGGLRANPMDLSHGLVLGTIVLSLHTLFVLKCVIT